MGQDSLFYRASLTWAVMDAIAQKRQVMNPAIAGDVRDLIKELMEKADVTSEEGGSGHE